jgi:hypothetical protein
MAFFWRNKAKIRCIVATLLGGGIHLVTESPYALVIGHGPSPETGAPYPPAANSIL